MYILASRSRRLYVGMTNDLRRRLIEHRAPGRRTFTARYAIVQLVYWESTIIVPPAIAREKQIKGWARKKKLDLIATVNPRFEDRTGQIL